MFIEQMFASEQLFASPQRDELTAAVKYLTNRRELEKAANKLGELGPRAGLGSLASWEEQQRTYVPGWGHSKKNSQEHVFGVAAEQIKGTVKNICSGLSIGLVKKKRGTYVPGFLLSYIEHMFAALVL